MSNRLYSTLPGRMLLKILTAPAVSKIAGSFMNSTLSKFIIEPFIKKNKIDMSDYKVENWKCFFLVDTLKYLEKGGRINKATAVMGSLLDIKPILGVDDGIIAAHDKLRGKKKLVDKLIEKVEEWEDLDRENPGFLIIHYNEEKANEAKQKLEEKFGVDIFVEFGPVVGTHVGPGAFAIIAKNKQEK